jgi:hypothetical protein
LGAVFYCPPSRRALYAQLAMDGAKEALLSPDALHKYFEDSDFVESIRTRSFSVLDQNSRIDLAVK